VRYATPQAFERALSDRLKRQAAEEGVDLDRLRKRVAFERFLARLFDQDPTRWMLKGATLSNSDWEDRPGRLRT
jgi:hypothetical protein